MSSISESVEYWVWKPKRICLLMGGKCLWITLKTDRFSLEFIGGCRLFVCGPFVTLCSMGASCLPFLSYSYGTTGIHAFLLR